MSIELWKNTYLETVNGDSALYTLILDVASLILEQNPYNKENLILSCRLFADAEREKNRKDRKIGRYIITEGQMETEKWIYSQWEAKELAIVKAPPSWGKTVLALKVALKEVSVGKKVLIITTTQMIDTFISTICKMAPGQIGDLEVYSDKKASGKIRLLCTLTRVSKDHGRAFRFGNECDILLTTSYYMNPRTALYRNAPGSQIPDTNIYKYTFDTVIIDEAHKGLGPVAYMWTALYNNANCKFLALSANEIILPPTLTFFIGNHTITGHYSTKVIKRQVIKQYVPKLHNSYVRFQGPDFPKLYYTSFANPTSMTDYTAMDARSREHSIWKAKCRTMSSTHYIEKILDILSRLKGRTLIFSHMSDMPWVQDSGISQIVHPYSRCRKYGWVWNRGTSDIEMFEKYPASENPVMLVKYGNSAEGINFNKIHNMILTNPSTISRIKYYQAVSRGVRVKSIVEQLNVINLIGTHIHDLLTTMIYRADEDFVALYMDRKTTKCRYTPKFSPSRLKLALDKTGNGVRLDISSEELFILFAQPIPSKDEYCEWVRGLKVFKTIDVEIALAAIHSRKRH